MSLDDSVVRRFDHVMVRAEDPGGLFGLFTEVFHLPVAWELNSEGVVTSGGVFIGNANLEFIRYDSPRLFVFSPVEKTSRHARYFGLAFEPFSMQRAMALALERKIPHSFPIPYSGKLIPFCANDLIPGKDKQDDGDCLWTICVLGGLLDASSRPVGFRLHQYCRQMGRFINYLVAKFSKMRFFTPLVNNMLGESIIFLNEYMHDVERVTNLRKAELSACAGGSLGLVGLDEVHIGVRDFVEKRRSWQRLLDPLVESKPGCWRLEGGVGLCLLPDKEDVIKTLVLKVASLDQTRNYLIEKNMLLDGSAEEVKLKPQIVADLDIRFIA